MEEGAIIGRWVVGRRLGRGGMAVVHEVTHADLGTRAALKVLHTTDPSVRGRMLREGRAQARLDHPNIVKVHDVLEVDGRTALLMEYVDGPDLAQWRRAAPRPVDQVLEVIRSTARALGAAHAAQIVHRDLKPANVLLAHGTVPKITDFGIAKILEDDGEGGVHTRSGTSMGTPAYMPPEQVRSARDIDARADLYALGVMAYELLAGVRPYPSTDDLVALYQNAMKAEFTPLREHNPAVPVGAEAAVHAALQGDLARRIPSVQAFLALFDQADAPTPEGADHTFVDETAQPSDLRARYSPLEPLAHGEQRRSWRGRAPDGRAVFVRGVPVTGTDPKTQELLRREAALLRQIDHPAIPRHVEAFDGEHEGVRYQFTAREWIEGEPLSTELARRRYDEDEVLDILEQTATILAHLHGLHPPVIHRDLQPANLIRRPDRTLALVDLGQVRDAFTDTLGGSTIAGRFGFMAPEQFGGDASPASDAWGLGALAVALLGRRDPAELMDDARALRWRDTVRPSAPMDTLLEGLLEPEVEDRVPNATEALRAVRRARKARLTHAERPAPETLREHLPPVLHQAEPLAQTAVSSAAAPPPGRQSTTAELLFVGVLAPLSILALLIIVALVFAPRIIVALQGPPGPTVVHEAGPR